MPTTDAPTAGDLPSSSRLMRSTAIALATAIVLLVVAVLPAEYGVDPTGVGRVLGLTEMGELKVALAKEAAVADAAAEAASAPAPQAPAQTGTATLNGSAAVTAVDSQWTHVTTVELVPNQGKEVKLLMAKGARAEYAWTATGRVNFDTHGDSTGAPNSYHGYSKGTGELSDKGALVAAFDGSHGWFWRNRTRDVVTVTLRTRGAYSELKKMN